MTRNEYIEGHLSHQEYYGSIAQAAGISLANSDLLPRIIKAIANGDEHLNTIPLHKWDGMAAAAQPAIAKALKKHGDFYTIAGAVCTLKAAARMAAQETK